MVFDSRVFASIRGSGFEFCCSPEARQVKIWNRE